MKTRSISLSLLAGMIFTLWPLAAESASEVQTLSAPGQKAREQQVAVDADGDAVAVWQRFDGSNWRIQARRRSASGALSAVQNLSAAGRNATDPEVAVEADGNAVVVWTRFSGTNWEIQARRRSASGALSAVQTLSAPGQNANTDPQVAVDADGDAVAVWSRFDGSNWLIQARRRSASGALSGVQNLSAPGQNAGHPRVAVDADGNAVAVWSQSGRIQARRRSASGAWSAVQTLSAPGQAPSEPHVAVDADGDAVAVWSHYDGMDSVVQARRRSASGALSAVQTLSATGQNTDDPQVAVDDDGDAVAVWRLSEGSNIWEIQARAWAR